jgi:hypothetical protein
MLNGILAVMLGIPYQRCTKLQQKAGNQPALDPTP